MLVVNKVPTQKEVSPYPHRYVGYSMEVKKRLGMLLTMSEVHIQDQSVFLRHGFVQLPRAGEEGATLSV